jgi:invasion protein IalB
MRTILSALLLCLFGITLASTAHAQHVGYTTVESRVETSWEKICNGSVCSYTIGFAAVKNEEVWIQLYLHNYLGERMLIVDTPKDSYLSRGIGLKAPAKDLGTVPYLHCRSDSCFAQIELTNADIAELDREDVSTFVLARDKAHSFGIPVSLKGLRAMLADIAPK